MKSHGRSHPSRLLIALVAAILLVFTAACGDDSGGGASSSPTDAERCDEVRRVLHQPVLEPSDAGPSQLEGLAAIRRFASEADGQAASDLTELAALLDRLDDDQGSMDDGDSERVRTLLDDVSVWALDECPPTEATWGCVLQSEFRPVGDRIGGDSISGGPTSDTPEETVGEGADQYERVEVERTSERVLFAFLDEKGLTRRTAEALRADDGWTPGATRICD